jgi:hypothetical protein
LQKLREEEEIGDIFCRFAVDTRYGYGRMVDMNLRLNQIILTFPAWHIFP